MSERAYSNVSLSSSEDEGNTAANDGVKRRFFTSHRQNLNRIQKDCASGKPTRHSVHDPYKKEADEFSASAYGGPEQWFDKHKHNLKVMWQQRSIRGWAEAAIPMVTWLKTYDFRSCLISDIIAGLTVGVMIVPQSMSYAKLAGLPVEYGLYSSLVPVYAYALFGTSRQLAVGPVALISLLLNSGLTLVMENKGMTPENTENYIEIYGTLAIQTSFLVGLCYIVMGVFRLGFITILLSHAVVSGFTSAAAIIIGMTQMKYLVGYNIPSDKSLHKMLYNIFKDIGKFNWRTFFLGFSCVAFLLGLKSIVKKVPKLYYFRALGPLIVTVVTIILQATVDLEKQGIDIVGYIPKGLPRFSGGDAAAIDDIGQLSMVVISIVVVGFMESIAIAKQLAGKNNYEIDSSKELVGLGVANLCGGLFSGYPLTGSFSRSAVNNEAGAKSGISSIVTATLVGFVLLLLTPVFELLVSENTNTRHKSLISSRPNNSFFFSRCQPLPRSSYPESYHWLTLKKPFIYGKCTNSILAFGRLLSLELCSWEWNWDWVLLLEYHSCWLSLKVRTPIPQFWDVFLEPLNIAISRITVRQNFTMGF